MAEEAEDLNFKFYLNLIILNSHIWLVATMLNSLALKHPVRSG